MTGEISGPEPEGDESREYADAVDESQDQIETNENAQVTLTNNTYSRGDGEPTELIVLDPDHPLMYGFQNALKNMLLKHINQVDVQLREKDEEVKREKDTHIEVGCELYNFQQELAKYQIMLEKKHNEYAELRERAEQERENLNELRNNYQNAVKSLAEETKKMHSMRDEVDALCLRLFYLNTAKEEVTGDIKVMQRAAEKATVDLSKQEKEKMRQDILVDRIQNKIDQLKEDIALYEAQIATQEAEMTSSQNLLHEAESQIVAITVDRKHLMSQWKTSLLGLQRRNEAYSALLKAFNELKEELLVLDNEEAAYRNSIKKEQQTHERLTVLLNKNEADLNTLKKQLLQVQTRHESDKQMYSTYSRMLQETERNLHRAQNENNTCQLEVNELRKNIEKESRKRLELDEKITEQLRERLTAQKAADYVKKLSVAKQDQSRELISKVAEMENQIAQEELAVAKRRAANKLLQEHVKELEAELVNRNTLITKMESEIHHANIQVERKQGNIDLLNKRLEKLISEQGGQEMGPLEATINSLNKSIAAKQEEIGELEQQWLKEQNELVKCVTERDDLAKALTRINKQLAILTQKKLKVDNEIAIQEREKNEAERQLRHLQQDMKRLNGLIAKERVTEENLANENKLAETDFVLSLREKEIEAAELQGKVDAAKNEKEDLLNELIDVERTIMLWEKKVQLCEETRRAVECDLGQGELSVMLHEIHRMEVRKSSLLQQQEKLLLALERSVSKRDILVTQSSRAADKKSANITRITAQRQNDELRKKLKVLKQNSTTCASELKELEDKIKELEQNLQVKRQTSEAEQKKVDELTEILQRMSDEKQVNLFELQMRQHAISYWEQVRDGRYRRLCPSSTSAVNEKARQLNRARALMSVIDKLISDFPQIQGDLNPVRTLLVRRLENDTESSQEDSGNNRTGESKEIEGTS